MHFTQSLNIILLSILTFTIPLSTKTRQNFTIEKIVRSPKQQILNTQKFFNTIHSYPLSANIFDTNILKMNLFTLTL